MLKVSFRIASDPKTGLPVGDGTIECDDIGDMIAKVMLASRDGSGKQAEVAYATAEYERAKLLEELSAIAGLFFDVLAARADAVHGAPEPQAAPSEPQAAKAVRNAMEATLAARAGERLRRRVPGATVEESDRERRDGMGGPLDAPVPIQVVHLHDGADMPECFKNDVR